MVWDTDENGNKIPETEKTAVLQSTTNGTINGKINMDTKTFDADLSISASGYWGEKNKTLTSSFSTRILGSLDENNNAFGTTTSGMVWNASPN